MNENSEYHGIMLITNILKVNFDLLIFVTKPDSSEQNYFSR